MPDLTFFNQTVDNPAPSMTTKPDSSKGGMLGKVLIIILVLAILGEAGYFFYNRYVSSGGKLPFQKLSTSGTMEQASPTPATGPNEPFQNTAQVSVVGDASLQKANDTVELISKYPGGFMSRMSINTTVEGKVVSFITNEVQAEEVQYTQGLRLVNPNGTSIGIRFSEEEVNKMRVIVVNKGEVVREAKYDEIKPGDMVSITTSVDLLDLRKGVDDVTIEIRTY